MIPTFRIAPAGAAQLAADADAPLIVWFDGERELVQVATSAAGLGIDLTGDQARVFASRAELGALLLQLDLCGSKHAHALRAFLEPVLEWRLRTRSLPLDRPVVMGILNLTDDSFSGDGLGRDVVVALRRADELRGGGADIIDIGAESARADRPVLDAEVEAEIAAKAVHELVADGHVVSIDTYKGGVARQALKNGAELVNDISGLTLGSDAAREAASVGAGYVLNYSYSVPKRRPQTPPSYRDVVTETVAWTERRLSELGSLGLPRESIAIDPGIAFGKSHDEDLSVLRRIGELATFGQPLLLAHSRKNFIGSVGGLSPARRDLETHVASALAYCQGVRIFRVHDVAGAKRALALADAIVGSNTGRYAPDEASWPWRAGATAAHMTVSEADKDAPEGQRW